ncbi:MAG: redoxin domain-containing protein [Sedimentisphaerales bacterium]|nr:redoxin domain-containing protein [Sedimentisphaerales bacterium]
MIRSKILKAVLWIFVFLAIVVAYLVVTSLRTTGRQRNQTSKIIDEVLTLQKLRHKDVENARAKLPQDSILARDWILEKAMTMWQNNEIETLAEFAKQFVREQGNISANDMEKLTKFVMESPELNELLEAIKCGLCEIMLDPTNGQWQISSSQIRALKSMAYMLACRAILLADKGDKQGAMETILNSYTLTDILLDIPNMHIQSYQPEMLLYIGYAIRRGLNPNEISSDSKTAISKYLDRLSSKEPIINALRLHEALVFQEVSAKHSTFVTSWFLAGYDQGIERLMQLLDKPQHDVFKEANKIVDSSPFYAEQTSWRLQNVASNAIQARVNRQNHAKSVSDFLGLQSLSLFGKNLPDLKDLGVTPVPDINDKIVLICFFDIEQRPSRNCILELSKKAKELKSKDIEIIVIQAAKVEQDELDNWIKENNISFPVGIITENEEQIKFNWGVKALPWLILTDKEHIVMAEGFSVSEIGENIK